MKILLFALVNAPPFVQWREIGGVDLLYLAPWVLLIWLLVPKNEESKTLRISWRSVVLWTLGIMVLTFVALVIYYILSGI